MPNSNAIILVTLFVLMCTAMFLGAAKKKKMWKWKREADGAAGAVEEATLEEATLDEEWESALCDMHLDDGAESLDRKDVEAKLPYAVVMMRMRHDPVPIELHQINRTYHYNENAMKAYNSVLKVIEKLHLQLAREHTWIKTPKSDPAVFQVTWFPPL